MSGERVSRRCVPNARPARWSSPPRRRARRRRGRRCRSSTGARRPRRGRWRRCRRTRRECPGARPAPAARPPIRSTIPSPVTSARSNAHGCDPTLKFWAAANVVGGPCWQAASSGGAQHRARQVRTGIGSPGSWRGFHHECSCMSTTRAGSWSAPGQQSGSPGRSPSGRGHTIGVRRAVDHLTGFDARAVDAEVGVRCTHGCSRRRSRSSCAPGAPGRWRWAGQVGGQTVVEGHRPAWHLDEAGLGRRPAPGRPAGPRARRRRC